jgi:hypothetical protein
MTVRFNIRGEEFTAQVPNTSLYALSSVVRSRGRFTTLDFRNGQIISGRKVIGDYAILDAPIAAPEPVAPKMLAQSDGRCSICGYSLQGEPSFRGVHSRCAADAAREG